MWEGVIGYEESNAATLESRFSRFRAERDFRCSFEGVVTLKIKNFIRYSDSTPRITPSCKKSEKSMVLFALKIDPEKAAERRSPHISQE